MVKASEGGSRQLQSAETDVVQRLVIRQHALVGVLNEPVEAEELDACLHPRVGHLGRQNDRERLHDAIRVLPADLGDQRRSHTRASPATKRVAQLGTLEAIAAVRLVPHQVQQRVAELCTLGVVSLRSSVARASLSEHNVVWPEQPSRRSRTDAVHGSQLEVHENRV